MSVRRYRSIRYHAANAPARLAARFRYVARWFAVSRRGHCSHYSGGAGHLTDGLAVAAVQGEGDAQFFAVLTAELESMQVPSGIACVHGNTTFVTPLHNGRKSRCVMVSAARNKFSQRAFVVN